MAGRRTLDSLGAADSVIDAMDLAAAETDRLAAAAMAGGSGGKAAASAPNPLLLGLTPAAYVLRAVQVSIAQFLAQYNQHVCSRLRSQCRHEQLQSPSEVMPCDLLGLEYMRMYKSFAQQPGN
jgi:hypothetical protein